MGRRGWSPSPRVGAVFHSQDGGSASLRPSSRGGAFPLPGRVLHDGQDAGGERAREPGEGIPCPNRTNHTRDGAEAADDGEGPCVGGASHRRRRRDNSRDQPLDQTALLPHNAHGADGAPLIAPCPGSATRPCGLRRTVNRSSFSPRAIHPPCGEEVVSADHACYDTAPDTATDTRTPEAASDERNFSES